MKNIKSEKASVRGDTASNISGHGKIMQSSVTEDMIEQRARELALIAGREPNRVIGSDRIQAKKELLGDDSADDAMDEENIMPLGMGSPPTSTGKHTKNHLPTDDEVEIQTVQEGVDEAAHDEMIEASKTRTRSEG
jgi:hypothetical protein